MARDFELRKEIDLEATPEQVWGGDRHDLWARRLVHAYGDRARRADVVVLDPPRRLALRVPGDEGSTEAFEYLVEGRDGASTILRFVHSGVLTGEWDDEVSASLRWSYRHLCRGRGRGPIFLGVRTADSLIRFHGRASLGMPIAVSHHIYSTDVDHEAVAKAWQSQLMWLSL